MYARWIDSDRVIKGKTVIKYGEVRKIVAKKDGKYILKAGDGYFGWVDKKEIEILKTS